MARGGWVDVREFWAKVFTSLGVTVISGVAEDKLRPTQRCHRQHSTYHRWTIEEARLDIRQTLDLERTNCIFNPGVMIRTDDEYNRYTFRFYTKSDY
jgi:hypothetical protein